MHLQDVWTDKQDKKQLGYLKSNWTEGSSLSIMQFVDHVELYRRNLCV